MAATSEYCSIRATSSEWYGREMVMTVPMAQPTTWYARCWGLRSVRVNTDIKRWPRRSVTWPHRRTARARRSAGEAPAPTGDAAHAMAYSRTSVSALGGLMSDEPSYLDLLNRISIGESEAECLLDCWASTTPNPAVRKVLSTIALREGEHGKAFAKRVGELGYAVPPADTGDSAGRMAIAAS